MGFNEAATDQSRKDRRLFDGKECARSSFNEAATDQSRKVKRRRSSKTVAGSFNEAATDQSRKGLLLRFSSHDRTGFNEAATDQSRKGAEAKQIKYLKSEASMRPRLISRGKPFTLRPSQRTTPRASMRPRLISRGKAILVSASVPMPNSTLCERCLRRGR